MNREKQIAKIIGEEIGLIISHALKGEGYQYKKYVKKITARLMELDKPDQCKKHGLSHPDKWKELASGSEVHQWLLELLTCIAVDFWDVGDEERDMGIGFDENGLPNSVSLEIHGRTHADFKLPTLPIKSLQSEVNEELKTEFIKRFFHEDGSGGYTVKTVIQPNDIWNWVLSHTPNEVSEKEIKQVFMNTYNCYVGAVDENGDSIDGEEPAMTLDEFMIAVRKLQLQQPSEMKEDNTLPIQAFLGWMETKDYFINDGEGHGLDLKVVLQEFLEDLTEFEG